ncbi:MAG: hypothetical protein II964_04900, partial [Synergistaceae bacterium]|nr:hypothetical protein [Synergistaceae bacterium]
MNCIGVIELVEIKNIAVIHFSVTQKALYLQNLLKVLILNAKLSEPLSNPVAASVFPTFTMATMLLAGYVKPYCPECASIIWYAGVIGHALLIVWFTMNFVVKGFAVKKVFP